MLRPLRQQLGLKSRRKKSNKIMVRFNYRDGNLVDREMSVDEFPRLCIGFKWPIPGIVLGQLPTSRFEGELIVRYDQKIMEKHERDDQAIRIDKSRSLILLECSQKSLILMQLQNTGRMLLSHYYWTLFFVARMSRHSSLEAIIAGRIRIINQR